MLSKEKFDSLTKYLFDLQNRLASPPSKKQKNRVKEFHQFLTREIDAVKAKLDAAKGL